MISSPRLGWLPLVTLLVGYVALDWASYIHPLHGLNITPWSPAPALGLVFLLRFGRKAAIPLGVAVLISDAWVRGLSASLPIVIGLSAMLTLGLWAMALVIRRRLGDGRIFADRGGLVDWAAIVAVGSAINGVVFIAGLTFVGLIPPDGGIEAFVQYWIGDVVGILVTMPVLWMLFDEIGRQQLRAVAGTWELAVYLVTTAVALAVAFGAGAEAHFKYFYVLFLPIAWAAARSGLTGAVSVAAAVQVGIIAAVQFLGFSAVTVLEIQALAVVLAVFGFFIGVVVDEHRRVGAELRQTLRLAAAGEMAGALAHELNQPLTALAAYGTACEELLTRGETGDRLRDSIRRMITESHRAADVVRRLRDFFRTGSTRLERVPISELLSSASAPFARRAEKEGIEFVTAPSASTATLADRLQIEIVLRNLLSNAFDAVGDLPGAAEKRVSLSARSTSDGRVLISVDDSGPGISAAMAARLFEPFHSSKSSGLGLGLAISRAIVEAHGGALWADVGDHGMFRVSLSEASDNG